MADVAVPLPRQKLPPIASPYHGLAHGSHHAMSTRSGGSSAPLRHGGPPGPPLQLPGPSQSSSSVASGNSLKRKRAGSTDADNGGSHPRARDLVVKVPTTATGFSFTPGFSSGEHMCLCTPAPKIPRPRNGESLVSTAAPSAQFRQHEVPHPLRCSCFSETGTRTRLCSLFRKDGARLARRSPVCPEEHHWLTRALPFSS